MLESKIQSKIITRLEKLGFFTTKIIVCSTPGFPDLLAIKKGETIYIEVKQPGKSPTPKQARVHAIIKHFGAKVHTIDSIQKLENILNE